MLELVGSAVLAALVAAGAQERPTTVDVAMFDGRGVSRIGFTPARDLLDVTRHVKLEVVTAAQIRSGALDAVDVVVFMGGSGSRQGEALRPEGRERVREFVARGGGYIGVCAGAYLAMQGEEEFHKLRIVSARNLSGDSWKRGIAPALVRPRGSTASIKLHFANGPVFEPIAVGDLPDYVTLATYESDLYASRHGTEPGQMPGTPAILTSSFRAGRIVLFSPNPVLGIDGVAHPELFLDAIAWAREGGPVPETTGYSDVFPSASRSPSAR